MKPPSLHRLALAGALLAASINAQAAETWVETSVDHFYLHNPPYSMTGLFRSQGVASDGQQWFFSWQYGLERTDDAFASLQRNSAIALPSLAITPGIPAALVAQGLNHIGDIDYASGLIYAPIEDGGDFDGDGIKYEKPVIALYNAADLSYTGAYYELPTTLNVNGTQENILTAGVPWVAVDTARGVGYTAEWNNATRLNVFNLDNWSFQGFINLDQTLDRIQGAKVRGDALYAAADNDTGSVYRISLLDGSVQEILQLALPAGSQEMEGLAFRDTPDGASLHVLHINDPLNADTSLSSTSINVALHHYKLVSAVPEPETYALMLAGLGLVGFMARRRKTA
ncbi:MAG: PEPxxWA-CTERM sorting domain-containing protein [Pseudomonadota bacterium]|nr:PEPxxWA-CTERM sorting domain-containing protein [Pseudomonadota bacterium]